MQKLTFAHKSWLKGASLLGLTALFTSHFWLQGREVLVYDWDLLTFLSHSVFRSIWEFGVLPVWNPWYCGGNVLWQNPQVPILSLAHILGHGIDYPLAVKLESIGYVFLGLWGMEWFLKNHTRWPFWVRCALAGGFAFSSYSALRLTVGHVVLMQSLLAPLLLGLFIKALKQPLWLAPASLLHAYIIYNGGVYPAIFLGIMILAFSFFGALFERSVRSLAIGLAWSFLSGALSMAKLLPTYHFMQTYPRHVDNSETIPLWLILRSLTQPIKKFAPQNFHPAFPHWWHEYGCYIGWVGLLLILGGFGILLKNWRREALLQRCLFLTAGFFFLFSFGDHGVLTPYHWVKDWPILSSLRVPTRLLIIGSALGFMGAAITFDSLLVKKGQRLLFGMICLFSTGHLFFVNRGIVNHSWVQEEPIQWAQKKPLHLMRSADQPPSYARMRQHFRYGQANINYLSCYEAIQPPLSFVKGQPVIFGEGVELHHATMVPGKIEAEISLDFPTRAYINQNYVEGWQLSGQALASRHGLPSLSLEPGRTTLQISYWPKGLTLGFFVSFVGLLLTLLMSAFLIKAGRPRNRSSEGLGFSESASAK